MGSPRRRRHAVVLQTAWVGVAGRSRCTTTATVHRPATCRVVAWADRSRCSRVRYVTVWNCLVVLTKHGAEGALPGAAEGWRVRYRRPADRRVKERSRRNDGTTLASRPVILPRVPWPDKSARRSLWSGARRGTRRAPGPKVGVGLGRAGTTTPRRLVGGHRLPEVSRARDNMRSTQSRAHRLVAAVDADSNRLRPARQPESGGLPRPRERSGRPGRPVQAGPQGP